MIIHRIKAKGKNKKKSPLASVLHNKQMILSTIVFAVIIVLLSSIYLRIEWKKYQNIASSEAIQLAQSLESLIHPEHITELSGGPEDLKNPDYMLAKLSLERLVDTTNSLRFAYILAERDGSIVFLLDSESSDSPDYSPPGQIYEEMDDLVWAPFKSGETTLTTPRTDRWGTWVSTLVPIKDPTNGAVIAVFGIDYYASKWYGVLWKQMIPPIIVVLCILILLIALINIWIQHNNLKNLSKKLEYSEALYHSIFNEAPIGIAIFNDKRPAFDLEMENISINPMFAQILGRTSHDFLSITWPEITHPEDLQADLEKFDEFKNGEIKGYSMEKRYLKPDGSVVWVHMIVSALHLLKNERINHLCLIQDITKQKAMMQEIEQQKILLQSFIDSSHELIYLKDENFRYLIANKALRGFFGVSIRNIIGKTDTELMDDASAANCRNSDQEAIRKNSIVSYVEIVNDKVYETRKFPVKLGGDKTGVGAYIRDITQESRQQEIINNISETNRIITECMTKQFDLIQEQLDFALHESLKLTQSQYGYIYFYDEKTEEFTLNSWTNGVMADCNIMDKQTKYQLDKTGIWGEVVRQRKPIIVNDFDIPNPLKKGYPEGHVQIGKYMSIPIFENERIVAVIGFANKISDYTANDIDMMTVLMSGVWIAVKRKEKEEETQRVLERTQSMINNHEAVMLLIEPFSGRIIEANNAASVFYGYSKKELLNMTIQDINTLDKEEISVLRMEALSKGQKYFTFPHRLKNGKIKKVDVYSSAIQYDDNKVLFSIIFDVTKREEATKLNEYLAYHDYLTGIYNRRFFEEEFKRRYNNIEANYPIAILLGDVNGLKTFNDTFGHLKGDEALKDVSLRISACINREDIFARVGGDEFAILLSNINEPGIRKYLDSIDQKVNYGNANKEINSITISFGYGIQREKEDTLDALMKEAEAFMYNRKYYNNKSAKSNTVNIIMETLFTKSEREKMHSERVGLICEAIAIEMNLDKPLVDEVRVAGFLHDIGKIGIDESILNKVGKLNKNEWEIMKLHPAKGARILENTIEFNGISDIILSHHERYDGSGYPNRLEGEKIPLASRIIAVADSYDAMTNDRSYRKKINHEEAITELKRCSGTHFDPEIVSVFIKEVSNKPEFSVDR